MSGYEVDEEAIECSVGPDHDVRWEDGVGRCRLCGAEWWDEEDQ